MSGERKLGVTISGSHNPCQDNGIKFFSHDGFKLPDDVEEMRAHGYNLDGSRVCEYANEIAESLRRALGSA